MGSTSTHVKHSLLLTLALPVIMGLLVTPAMLSLRHDSTRHVSPTQAVPPTPSQARETYGRIPLSFEANQGQTESSVDFLARGAGYTLFLKPTEAVFALRNAECGMRNADATLASTELDNPLSENNPQSAIRNPQSKESAICDQQSKVLRMRLVGADAGAAVEGADELAGKVNYFNGNDPAQWRTRVPTFARVRYAEVYPGIDVIYYGNGRQLEYDFVVAPGRDTRALTLQFDGADKIDVDAAGDLLLTLGESVIRQPKPFVYQEVAGARRAVEGGYAVGNDGRVGFSIGEYDAQLPLIIDPVLVYSTYLGGSGGEQALAIALDPSGNAYITGFTFSTNYPVANALQSTNGGFQDAFVTKLNAAGTALVYSTYLGGSAGEQARGLAVDSAGNAYVMGFTSSTDFPLVNALQATIGSDGQDAFVTKLNAAGSALVYSTYLGGSESAEFGEAIAVDSAGNAYVTGSTFSDDYPTVNAIQDTNGGGSTDAFLTKINAAGTALVYSTYLGGSGNEIGESIAVDSAGNAYVSGDTGSTNFPIANAVQATSGGDQDAFVVKVNANGNAFVYSTYLGGSALDEGEAITADSAGNAYVSGDTLSTNFPTVNAIQPANGGGVIQDAYVTKINATGSAFVYSTYLGGTGGEIGFGIKVDSSGNAYIAGATGSNFSFPTANALQCTSGGAQDVFVTKLNAAGSAFIYSTYLGGSGVDNGRGIAIDSAGSAYVGGFTRSANFPVVNAIQSAFGGDVAFGDAFVTKIGDTSTLPASALQFSQATYTVNEDVTFVNAVVQRTGDMSGAITVDYATSDGTASERSDYTTALGTLRFAAGQSEATVPLLISEDSLTEGAQSFTIMLLNPTGGATLSCAAATATIQITDDASEPSTNAIDDPAVFVGQHYHDFLNRQSDASGMSFWTNEITSCGSNANCVAVKRTNVSTAFFLSIEFQRTGFEVIRIYRATFPDSPTRPRGLPRYREFLRDTQEVQRGVVVGVGNFEQQLNDNRINFARAWVQRPDFIAEFPQSMTADDYINKLFANSGVTPTPAEFNIAFDAFNNGGVQGRAQALLAVTGSGSVFNRQFNPAFVLMQYIGYLRRNPNDAPEPGLDYAGFDFWLAKLNQFSQPGEDVRNEQVALARAQRAELVRAFITSTEYRQRFGQ